MTNQIFCSLQADMHGPAPAGTCSGKTATTAMSVGVDIAQASEVGVARMVDANAHAGRSCSSHRRERIVYPPPPVHQRSRPPPVIGRYPAITPALFRSVV
jgi:hypothetical protein